MTVNRWLRWNTCMSKTNHHLVIGLKDSYNSTFCCPCLWFIRSFTQTAKNTSLAWDQAPGKKEKQQPLGSLRSPLFFLFYPVFCLFSPIRSLVPGSDYRTFCFGIARRHKTYDVKSSIRSNQRLLKFAKCSGGSRGGAPGGGGAGRP